MIADDPVDGGELSLPEGNGFVPSASVFIQIRFSSLLRIEYF
jgi:hypothetical protein